MFGFGKKKEEAGFIEKALRTKVVAVDQFLKDYNYWAANSNDEHARVALIRQTERLIAVIHIQKNNISEKNLLEILNSEEKSLRLIEDNLKTHPEKIKEFKDSFFGLYSREYNESPFNTPKIKRRLF